MRTTLLRAPSQDDLIQVLLAWRIWLVATLVGAVIGSAIYHFFPPDYRARATVTVDQNLEQAWPKANTERELMTYLSRETQKLVELAWSDATLQMVVDGNPGASISQLRAGVLQLNQTSDGAWHFWADNREPDKAANLASCWAKAFYERSLEGINVAVQIQTLQASLAAQPADTESIKQQLTALEAKSMGINPYLQVTLSQVENIPVERTTSQGTAILFSAAIAWVVTFLGSLFFRSNARQHGNP